MSPTRKPGAAAILDVGYFGKLPQFADFIQYRAAYNEVRELDEYFQLGLVALNHATGGGIDDDYPEMPPVQFLFHCAPPAHCLVGAFRTSYDRAGRRYPFAVFGVLDCRQVSRWHTLVPLVFNRFLDGVEALLDDAPELVGAQVLMDRVEDLEWPLAESIENAASSYAEFVRETASDDFMDGALPDEADALKRHAVARLYALCAPLRRKLGGGSALAVRYPLAADAPALFAAYWLELSFRLLAWTPPAPVWFWMPRTDRPFLLALLGRPVGKTFLHLLRDDVADEKLCDLSAPAGRAVDANPTELPLAQQPALSLAEVLRRAGG